MTTITTLVDNSAAEGFLSEHGLSFWIEYEDKRILFDTGQSTMFMQNARKLGIDLARTDAIVISHGHYDHTGGLAGAVDIASKATVYLHPASLEPKFNLKKGKSKSIGMAEATGEMIRGMADNGKVVWTESPVEVFPGIFATGQIPRATGPRSVGSNFFLDNDCQEPDIILDDQSLFFDSPDGLVIVLGCAHSGVANILNYIAKLSGKRRFFAVMGGMHLLHSSSEEVELAIELFREYDVRRIGLAHCTGDNAMKQFNEAFPDRCFMCWAGTKIEFGN